MEFYFIFLLCQTEILVFFLFHCKHLHAIHCPLFMNSLLSSVSVQVYIIGGDGTLKGAAAIFEVTSLYTAL